MALKKTRFDSLPIAKGEFINNTFLLKKDKQMKITNETKVIDLIPEGFELYEETQLENVAVFNISIQIKEIEVNEEINPKN